MQDKFTVYYADFVPQLKAMLAATTGVPESFLIGRDGIIYKHYAGETRWDSETNVELVRRLVEDR